MSVYLLLNLVIIISFLFLGIKVYQQYKHYSGIFFLIFSIAISIWFFLYALVFSLSFSENTILLFNRIMYALSLIFLYSMVFFSYFFNINKKKNMKKIRWIFIIFFLLFCLSVFSPYILESVQYIEKKSRYIEIYGALYPIFAFLYLINTPLLIYILVNKFKTLHNINRIRLKLLSAWYLIFISLSILFLVVLPLVGKNILDNEIVFLVIPFFVWTVLSIRGYNFLNVHIILWKVIIFSLSLFFSILSVSILKYYYFQLGVWWIQDENPIWDIILSVIVFSWFYLFFEKIFLWHLNAQLFSKSVQSFKKQISFTTDIRLLNQTLSLCFKKYFKINHASVSLFNDANKNSELYKFFLNDIHYGYFLNDIVFIEENKNKFFPEKIVQEFNPKAFIISPLYNNKKELIWFFSIWKKPFKDYFYSNEIEVLKDFASYLEGHLKYIQTYQDIKNLSINLDHQVTEKTLKYNNLINKQKEFIALISHEIKSPIASAIFQADCLHDDVKNNRCTTESLKEELDILNQLLLKAGNLINKLFSIQQFEIQTIQLFKEKIDIGELLETEANLFQKMHTDKSIYVDIQNDLYFIDIDKIQFKQVIDNLITNAIKFSDKNNGKVIITANKGPKYYTVDIEDNWKWFTDLDITKIFDKYSTGNSNSIWLWMGLYLCKKIVELHWGTIQANFWKKLWWAKISVRIPLI